MHNWNERGKWIEFDRDFPSGRYYITFRDGPFQGRHEVRVRLKRKESERYGRTMKEVVRVYVDEEGKEHTAILAGPRTRPDGSHVLCQCRRAGNGRPCLRSSLLEALLYFVNGTPTEGVDDWPVVAEIEMGSHCIICGRALSVPESCEHSIGPECRKGYPYRFNGDRATTVALLDAHFAAKQAELAATREAARVAGAGKRPSGQSVSCPSNGVELNRE